MHVTHDACISGEGEQVRRPYLSMRAMHAFTDAFTDAFTHESCTMAREGGQVFTVQRLCERRCAETPDAVEPTRCMHLRRDACICGGMHALAAGACTPVLGLRSLSCQRLREVYLARGVERVKE